MNKLLKAILVFVLSTLCIFAGLMIYNKVLKLKNVENSNNIEEHAISNEVEIVKMDSMIQLIGNSNIKRYCVKENNETPDKNDECFKDFEENEASFEILKDNYYIWVEDEDGKISDSIIVSDFNKDLPVQEDNINIEGTENIDQGIENINQGTKSIKQEAENIDQGTKNINQGTKSIKQEAENIDQGAENINQGTKNINQGTKELVNVTYNYNLLEAEHRNGQGIAINYNPTYQIIQINGTWTGTAINIGKLFNIKVNNGEKYKVTLNYVSGSYTTNETSKPRFVFELQANEKNLKPRSKVEILLPLEGKKTLTLAITSKNNEANNFRFWLYENETNVTTFNNYRIQIFITKDETKQIEIGSIYGEQPIPEKEGYAFLGWYDSLSGNNKIESTTKLTKTNSQTLYAHWKKGKYSNVNYSKFEWTKYNANQGPAKEYMKSYINSYAIFAPKDSKDLNNTSLPLIIVFHGAGQFIGESAASQYLDVGIPSVISEWKTLKLDYIPAIIIVPHGSNGWWSGITTNNNTLRALVSYAKDYYNIDTTKIVYFGHSAGGFGAVEMAWDFKEEIPAYKIVTMSSQQQSYKGSEGQVFYSKIPIRGYGEIQTQQNFFNWIGQPQNFTYYSDYTFSNDHMKVPKRAMTEDLNNDGVSDLMYWLFGEDAKTGKN